MPGSAFELFCGRRVDVKEVRLFGHLACCGHGHGERK